MTIAPLHSVPMSLREIPYSSHHEMGKGSLIVDYRSLLDYPSGSQITRLARSTFMLVNNEGPRRTPIASGFMISSDGLGVIAKHCLTTILGDRLHDHLSANTIYRERGATFFPPLRVVSSHRVKDVALVKVHNMSGDPNAFLGLNPDLPDENEILYKCGYPMQGCAEYVRVSDPKKHLVAGRVEFPRIDANTIVERAKQISYGNLSGVYSNFKADVPCRGLDNEMLVTDGEEIKTGFSGGAFVDQNLSVRAVQIQQYRPTEEHYRHVLYPAIEGRNIVLDEPLPNYTIGCPVSHVIELLDELSIDYRLLAEGEPSNAI